MNPIETTPLSDRHAQRRERLTSQISAESIDALLLLSEANIRYLTGFTGHDAWLLVTVDRAIIISDGRFTTQLDQECPGIEPLIRPIGQAIATGAGELIAKLGLRRVGVEAGIMTVANLEAVREQAPATEFGHASGYVEALRMIKDEGELASIRAAVASAERAYEAVLARIGADDTEKTVADRLEWELRKAGAESASFPPIVAAGVRAALPHARPLATSLLRDSELLLIDWGASVDGYKSDLTRVLPTGKVTCRLEQVYQTVLAAQARAIAAIRPGVLAKKVDAEARFVIEAAGFGDAFTHGTGHGLGLEIHESPMMRGQTEIPLQPGMVVTVEPGIYLPDWGGVRIEDDVLVTEDGAEILTRVPKRLEELAPLFG